MKVIKACRYNDPCVDEIIRYAGGITGVIRLDGFVLLVKPKHGLIKPWIRMNMERLKSFGIEGEVIDLTKINNNILG